MISKLGSFFMSLRLSTHLLIGAGVLGVGISIPLVIMYYNHPVNPIQQFLQNFNDTVTSDAFEKKPIEERLNYLCTTLDDLKRMLITAPDTKTAIVDRAHFSWGELLFNPALKVLGTCIQEQGNVKKLPLVSKILVQIDAISDEFDQPKKQSYDADLSCLSREWARRAHEMVQLKDGQESGITQILAQLKGYLDGKSNVPAAPAIAQNKQNALGGGNNVSSAQSGGQQRANNDDGYAGRGRRVYDDRYDDYDSDYGRSDRRSRSRRSDYDSDDDYDSFGNSGSKKSEKLKDKNGKKEEAAGSEKKDKIVVNGANGVAGGSGSRLKGGLASQESIDELNAMMGASLPADGMNQEDIDRLRKDFMRSQERTHQANLEAQKQQILLMTKEMQRLEMLAHGD